MKHHHLKLPIDPPEDGENRLRIDEPRENGDEAPGKEMKPPEDGDEGGDEGVHEAPREANSNLNWIMMRRVK